MDITNIYRSDCGISCALDVIGDKWSLLIIRDIVIFHKRMFKEFVASSEHIATNILADRLKKLEKQGLIKKKKAPNNLKVNHYSLTDKGLDLVPLLLELQKWSDVYIENATDETIKKLSEENQNNLNKTRTFISKRYLKTIA